MKRDDFVSVQYIFDEIENSIKNVSKAGFKKDLNLKDATERRISIIGEAAKNISLDFKEKYSEIDWRVIVGTREIMVHAYFSVDLNQV